MEKIKEIKLLLEEFDKKDRMYWIDSMVKLGYISKSEAGYIITIERL